MKILALSNLYPPDFIGGYELACGQVVDALRARGHDVQVLTSVPRTPVPHVDHVHRRFKVTDVWNDRYLERCVGATRNLWQAESHFVNAFNVHVLAQFLDEFAPDVVYICNLVGLGGLGLMGTLHHLRVPWVWQLGDCVPLYLCTRGEEVLPALAREFDRQLRGRYIAVSQRLVDEIAAEGITLKDRVDVLPNWVVGSRPPDRAGYLDGGRLRIATAGQIAFHKGIDILIEAAARLREAGYRDFAIDIYGKATTPYFQNLAHKYEVDDYVKFPGLVSQQELAERYRGYDLFAFPTWEREPFGLAPLEAAAQGCVPVIAQSCGIGEWLVHGVHCLKADRTADAFAQVFAGVLDRRIDLERLGRRGTAAVWRDFHLDTLMPRFEQILGEASCQSRAGAGRGEEVYRMARLAESLVGVLVQEAPWN